MVANYEEKLNPTNVQPETHTLTKYIEALRVYVGLLFKSNKFHSNCGERKFSNATLLIRKK